MPVVSRKALPGRRGVWSLTIVPAREFGGTEETLAMTDPAATDPGDRN